MTDAEFTQTVKLVEALRARGVTQFELDAKGGVRFTFGPPLDTAPKKATAPAHLCKCGHAEWEHNGGACLKGCDVEKCEVAGG